MDSANILRKSCLKTQTELRGQLENSDCFNEAISLFLDQHARLHSKRLAAAELPSFADEVLGDIPADQMRMVPARAEHSIAWLVWHMARCEDITMNLLVAGTPQVLLSGGWLQRTRSPIRDTGNALEAAAIADFSNAIDVEALLEYRMAVGRRTQEIARELQPTDLKRKVEPGRIQRIYDEGAVVEAARGIADYWSKRTVAGLLLMPATRHNLIHLGEALLMKRRFGLATSQRA